MKNVTTAKENLTLFAGDAKDAYAHSPPSTIDAYLSIDDQYADWYKSRYGKDIDRRKVVKIQHALQGHPEAGRLWQHHINDILINKMGFQNTTHDSTIYFRKHDDHVVYLLRQVDDFAIASKDEEIR